MSDAGSSDVNGVYSWDCTTTNDDDNPLYVHENGDYYLHADNDGLWVINDSEYYASQYGSYYYNDSNTGYDANTSLPPLEYWSTEDGASPSPSFTIEAIFTISDAGDEDINGNYIWDGFTTNDDGNPVYQYDYDYYYLHADNDGLWVINDSEYYVDQYDSYYYNDSNTGYDANTSTPPTEDWQVQNGFSPEPAVSCGTPPPPPPPAVSLGTGCWADFGKGRFHTSAIKADGTLWGWGRSSFGRLGNGSDLGNVTSPMQIGTDDTWAKISVGDSHTLAIKSDGTLWAWGYNGSGECGLDPNTHGGIIYVPTQVGTDTDWETIDLGSSFVLAIKTNGTLWSWGNCGDGKLGNGIDDPAQSIVVPTQVGSDTDWASISAGYYHSLAIKTDGTFWSWGRGDSGRIGTGSTANVLSPTQVGTATDWASVSAGNSHSMGVKIDGTLWAWGNGENGRMGTGSSTDLLSPTQVGTDTDWESFRAGDRISMGIKTNGTRWGCGWKWYGQLGDGNSSGSLTVLTQLGVDADWSKIVLGLVSHCALGMKADDTFLIWGDNTFGQLGNGTEEGNALVPIAPSEVYIPAKGITKTITTTTAGIDGDWVYYTNPVDGGYIFAINWAPDGSLASGNELARNATVVTLDVLSDYQSEENGADASFMMARYWNVNTGGNSISEAVNIRYFYDLSEITDIETAAANYAASNSSPLKELQWFKLNEDFDPSSDNSSTFNPDVYLTASSTGVDGCQKNYVQFDGITSFSGGGAGVGVGAAFPGTQALPVELISFTARNEGKENLLLWSTASEENNAGFQIERSRDARDWEILDFVVGKGATDALQQYSYTDARPILGDNYYRLKQIDFDGQFEYSDVRIVRVGDSENKLLEIFPNPSRGQFTLSLRNPNLEKARIKLFDSTGNMIWQKDFRGGEAVSYWEKQFDLPQREVYFVMTQVGDVIETMKVSVISDQ